MTDDLMTYEEAAEYLHITKRYLAETLVKGGKITIYRISPRKALISKADIEKYIKTCRGSYKIKESK